MSPASLAGTTPPEEGNTETRSSKLHRYSNTRRNLFAKSNFPTYLLLPMTTTYCLWNAVSGLNRALWLPKPAVWRRRAHSVRPLARSRKTSSQAAPAHVCQCPYYPNTSTTQYCEQGWKLDHSLIASAPHDDGA